MGTFFRNSIRIYRDISIKNKLLYIFLIQILIPVILIGCLFYQKTSNTIKSNAIIYSHDVMKLLAYRLEDYVSQLTKVSDDVIYNSSVNQDISETLKTKVIPGENGIDYYYRAQQIIDYMRSLILERPEIESIALISKSKNYYYYDSNITDYTIKDMFPYDKAVKIARANKGNIVWFIDKKSGGDSNIYLIRTIYDEATLKEIGMMTFLIKPSYFQSAFDELSHKTMENLFIVNNRGAVIVKREVARNSLITSLKVKKNNTSTGYYIDNKLGMLVSYVNISPIGWKVVNFISLKNLYSELIGLKNWLILLILLILSVLSVISMLVARDIINPINKLVNAMKGIPYDKKHNPIELNRNDEIGFLSKNFNNMTAQIDYLIHGIYQEKITRRDAEIKALQSQINPHFLCNTLESVNWLAQLNNVPQISDMVTALCSLMDASIGRTSKLVKLKEEFGYIDDYITIAKYRYEDRLEFNKNIEEEILHVNVPRLILQPIVENAIKHNVDRSRKKIVIQVNGYVKNFCTYIEIIDFGLGIDFEKLEEINSRLQNYDIDVNSNNKSVGMDNVNKRLKLIYGEEYGIRIESKKGEYTKVIVKLPNSNAMEDDCNVQGYDY